MHNAHCPDIRQPINSTALRMLQAAAQFVGGENQLAARLRIGQPLVGRVMAGRYSVPESLLRQAVHIVLAYRESLLPFATTPMSSFAENCNK
jgi:hypothetical protein